MKHPYICLLHTYNNIRSNSTVAVFMGSTLVSPFPALSLAECGPPHTPSGAEMEEVN